MQQEIISELFPLNNYILMQIEQLQMISSFTDIHYNCIKVFNDECVEQECINLNFTQIFHQRNNKFVSVEKIRFTGKIAQMVEPALVKFFSSSPEFKSRLGGFSLVEKNNFSLWIPDSIWTTILKYAYQIYFNYMGT